MKQSIDKWMMGTLLGGLLMLGPYAHSQQNRQYAQQPGQAVFVQPPYGSSVYTEYRYSPNQKSSNRLPSYTTNQSVFIQQPYGASQHMRVEAYPSRGRDSLPATESRYSTPADFPSTTSPAYPFATVRSYTSSPYSTTIQSPSYTYQPAPTYTSTQTYPYTSTRQVVPAPTIHTYGSYAHPNTTIPNQDTAPYPTTTFQTPYPMTTAPEATVITPPPTSTTTNTRYYTPNPHAAPNTIRR